MKRLSLSYVFFLLILFFLSFSCHRREKAEGAMGAEQKSLADTGVAGITFEENSHDFGTMTEGEEVSYVFTFRNNGRVPLIITSAVSSCGCTVPKFPHQPVPPGEKGELEVLFNSTGKTGAQRKTIAVRANTSPPVTLLTITALVEPAKGKKR